MAGQGSTFSAFEGDDPRGLKATTLAAPITNPAHSAGSFVSGAEKLHDISMKTLRVRDEKAVGRTWIPDESAAAHHGGGSLAECEGNARVGLPVQEQRRDAQAPKIAAEVGLGRRLRDAKLNE